MRILFTTTMVAALAVALPACGQQTAADEAVETATESLSALSGTWTVDLASLKFGGKPDEFGVNGGNYDCASCIPPLSARISISSSRFCTPHDESMRQSRHFGFCGKDDAPVALVPVTVADECVEREHGCDR